MSDHAVMPYQHYKNACDAIRAKGAGSASIKSGDMAAAIKSISGGAVSSPDISFTHLHDCPPLDKNDKDYFGENVRTYLIDHLSQPGDLLLTVLIYVGPTTMQLNIPMVANWTVNGHTDGVSMLTGISTPKMVPLFKNKIVKDLGFELDNGVKFFRIRGCRLFSSVISSSGRINGANSITFTTPELNSAIFGVAFSSTASDMLTCSTNRADNDFLKHVFSTFEFDDHSQHIRGAFFGAIKQSNAATDDFIRLTIKNPTSGVYTYAKTGNFYE